MTGNGGIPSDPASLETSRWPACDLERADSRLRLVRDIVALANTGGGRIVIGVGPDGEELGVAAASTEAFDAGFLSELVAMFTAPDRVDVDVRTVDVGGGRAVLTVEIPAAPEPPLVLSEAGIYENDDGTATVVFEAHAVVVRRRGGVGPAHRDDYRRWRDEARALLRRELQERLAMVIDAAEGATVRVIGPDEVRDEPNFFLSRSADVFRRQPERLLAADDLGHLWLHRHALTFDATSRELVIQSALRRRATVYLWLSFLQPSAHEIRGFLFRALEMRDRDKSDAARSVLFVAALMLDEDDYDRLVERLAESSYAHMREAATQLPTMAAARSQLDSVEATPVDGVQLRIDPMESQLVDTADRLLRRNRGRPPRRLGPIGLELFRLQLDRSADDGRPRPPIER
ncbi:MAG: RNA-binding domain-containing protein [Acidimicrobiales bacterium]